MRYFGGKSRIAKKIVEFIENDAYKPNQYNIFIEPFVGGLNITPKLTNGYHGIFCSDINNHLIKLYKDLQNDDIILPDTFTKQGYDYYKGIYKLYNRESNSLAGFIGHGLSHSGKWFGGFTRDNTNRNYCKNAKNSLLKKIKLNGNFDTIIFVSMEYESFVENAIKHTQDSYSPTSNMIIYCDPPYENTSNGYINKSFDHNRFWKYIEDIKQNNENVNIYVSSYHGHYDTNKICLEIETKSDMNTKKGKEKRKEVLYKI